MSGRAAEQVRDEIASERVALRADVDGLKHELRALLPFAIAGLGVIVLAATGAVLLIRKLKRKPRTAAAPAEQQSDADA